MLDGIFKMFGGSLEMFGMAFAHPTF